MDLPAIEPRDEGAHTFDGSPDWTEAWHFGFFDDAGTFGGYARITLVPARKQAWYWAGLYRQGELLVSVIDNEVGLPRLPGSLETRGNGLWVDHNCETPLEHWSIGAEAFGLGVSDPADVVGSMRGDMVPFGLDLEWETNGPVQRLEAMVGYTMSCQVHGEILVGDDVIDSQWRGFRRHTWGPRPPATLRIDSAGPGEVATSSIELPSDPGTSQWATGFPSEARTLGQIGGRPTTDVPANAEAGIGDEFTPLAWLPARSEWSTGAVIQYLTLGTLSTGDTAWLETPGP